MVVKHGKTLEDQSNRRTGYRSKSYSPPTTDIQQCGGAEAEADASLLEL